MKPRGDGNEGGVKKKEEQKDVKRKDKEVEVLKSTIERKKYKKK